LCLQRRAAEKEEEEQKDENTNKSDHKPPQLIPSTANSNKQQQTATASRGPPPSLGRENAETDDTRAEWKVGEWWPTFHLERFQQAIHKSPDHNIDAFLLFFLFFLLLVAFVNESARFPSTASFPPFERGLSQTPSDTADVQWLAFFLLFFFTSPALFVFLILVLVALIIVLFLKALPRWLAAHEVGHGLANAEVERGLWLLSLFTSF